MKKRSNILPIVIRHLLVGFIFSFAAYVLCPDGKSFNRVEFILASIITFASTFSGFILTAVTVLLGYGKTHVMKAVNSSKAKNELSFRYCESILCGLILIITCMIIGELIPQNNVISRMYLCIGVGILAYYVASLISTGYYLVSLIAVSSDEDNRSEAQEYIPQNGFNIKRDNP